MTGKLSLRDKISHYVKRGGVKQTKKMNSRVSVWKSYLHAQDSLFLFLES
jgi:hypothetical protein